MFTPTFNVSTALDFDRARHEAEASIHLFAPALIGLRPAAEGEVE
jgi:hypothetical protein